MASSVTAIQDGFDYQAYLFWLHAGRMLNPYHNYLKVGYEFDGVKSFDDVVIFFRTPRPDHFGQFYDVEHYQVKYRVDNRSSIIAADLIDPEFIGATKDSFLMKVKKAHESAQAEGRKVRFVLVTHASIDENDCLKGLIRNRDREFNLEKLAEGKTKGSSMFVLREEWRAHLNLPNDEALFELLKVVRLETGSTTLNSIRRNLVDVLFAAGLKPLDLDVRTDVYPQLIRRLHGEGNVVFTKDEILEICKQEKLLLPAGPFITNIGIKIGIRSFLRFAEDMHSDTDKMICLVKYFDGRKIINPDDWNEKVRPDIEQILVQNSAAIRNGVELYLDTHMTCAFIVGLSLPIKMGVPVAVLQKTPFGRELWKQEKGEGSFSPMKVEQRVQFGNAESTDIGLAISITHNILDDVVNCATKNIPILKSVDHMVIQGDTGPQNTIVESGAHASVLAMQIHKQLMSMRVELGDVRIHIFIAAPNALVFFLGRLLESAGSLQLYEHSFDGSLSQKYVPSLTIK
jgi:hypothetical protein